MSNVERDVLIERARVSLSERSATSAMSAVLSLPRFSRIRSRTTMVSLTE